METTTQLLDKVKSRYHLPSDYALAKRLGMSSERISKYRRKGGALAEENALRVAELLELDEGYVLACMEAERAQSDAARKAWERLADRLKSGGTVAALLLLVAVPALSPTPAEAAPARAGAVVCILCKVRRALARTRSSLALAGRYGQFSYAALSA